MMYNLYIAFADAYVNHLHIFKTISVNAMPMVVRLKNDDKGKMSVHIWNRESFLRISFP